MQRSIDPSRRLATYANDERMENALVAPATLKDVARMASVSPRTVSNVVNGHDQVSEAMRAKVQRAIDDLGYRPNVTARNLRKGRTGILSFVLPEIDVPYFAELARAMIEAAARRGYRIMLEQTDGELGRERELLAGSSATMLFDGVIFSPVEMADRELRTLGHSRPLLLLGEHTVGSTCDHVAIDNVQAARDATEHLISLGRNRIAAIGRQEHDTARLRTAGYASALRHGGFDIDEGLIIPTSRFHREDGAAAMRQLLTTDTAPDAVFCYSDLLALGAMRVALESGLRIPQDIAFVGVDDIEDGRYSTPTLTTIAPDKVFIATQAVDRIIDRIEDPGVATADVVALHRLEVRESTVGIQNLRVAVS